MWQRWQGPNTLLPPEFVDVASGITTIMSPTVTHYVFQNGDDSKSFSKQSNTL